MARSMTTNEESFLISRPMGDVRFTMSTDPNAPAATITIPRGSAWTPEPHWHERYTEYVRVKQGRARLVINGEPRVITSEDGEQAIRPFEVHEFMRADFDQPEAKQDPGDVIISERVDPGLCRILVEKRAAASTLNHYAAVADIVHPADGLKEVFFRNLISTILQPAAFGKWQTLQIMAIFNNYDNFPVLVNGPFSWVISRSVFAAGSGLAWLFGLNPWYEEYTPDRLRDVARLGGTAVKSKSS